MSFYTALTGLKGAQTDISTTSNNIANVGSNGFKKSRADFGDIFGSTPMQTNQVGVGTQVKSITQQFGQGNLTTSSNTLDMAVSGQGFFAMQTGGATPQTVYTRNGAFNVDDTGFVVDSNGQFLLGYPVDDDGGVANKTLEGSNKLQLKSEYGAPTLTTNIAMGVNLNAKEPVLPADNIFDVEDPDTYTSAAAVTIFDKLGNPQSATVYYLKTQDQTNADPTFKYDTKLFVDGVEITPTLTRASDPQEKSLFIDKFGQQTTVPQDPAYILEGKASPLYRADDLGLPIDSTPAILKSNILTDFLDNGKIITITTNPLEFQSTRDFQLVTNVASPDSKTFWGKNFLLVDIDASGPVPIDIPPGTYNGTQLAAAVEVATQMAFGDDTHILLTAKDRAFTIDFKTDTGNGLSVGLAVPISVDLLGAQTPASTVAKITNDGLPRDTFLAHTQARINDEMNKYIQAGDAGGAGGIYAAAGVNVTNVNALGANGKLFKKLVGTAITPTDVPRKGFGALPNVAPTGRINGLDIARVIHKTYTAAGVATAAINRYVAYSNDVTGAEMGKPEVKAYDYHVNMKTDAATGLHPAGHQYAGLPFFEVPQTAATFSLDAKSVRLFQVFENGKTESKMTDFFGTKDIAIKATAVGATAGHYQVTLDYDMKGSPFPTLLAAERNVSVLAMPSEDIVAYFESTAGYVEGVEEAHFTNKIVVQEIGASAKRTAAPVQPTTAHAAGNISMVWAGTTAAAPTTATTLASTNNLTELGLAANAGILTTNWIDDRNPAVKVGYDEVNQRLTFDADNAQLGLGTGIKKDSFTVYSQVLTDGSINGVGIPAFGNSGDISLATDDKLIGDSFINTGIEVQPANKRYGMDVYFDTVNNVFDFSSGTTGETLAANSALGVTANQSKSDIAIGRYKLTIAGEIDTTDDATIVGHKIGQGISQILGFPREGEVGYTAATGLASTPAIATGADALINMQKAFTLTNVANENKFTVVLDGVSAYIDLPQKNYTGTTLAAALKLRINIMEHPITGAPIGGVDVKYNSVGNNLVFTTGTTGDSSTLKVVGAVRFGLDDVALGIGKTAEVKVPSIATDANNRPLYIAPDGVTVTSDISAFENNIVTDFYPLYLDNGELTFLKSGELQSPITKVTYEGLQDDITVDFSNATQFSSAFSAQAVTQDGKGAGQLTNLEIDNLGNILAGYSNGTNVSLGKIILANFTNNAGLKQIGNSTFSATAASGAAKLGEATMDGFGNIMSGSLERSNVDITEELVNLITAQRNYQAAAKAMETTTSMTQTIINIRQ